MTSKPTAEQAPTLVVGALPAAVTSLLAAIVDALDVPLADQLADDSTAAALMRQRANETRIITASVLRDLDARNIEGAAEQLRGWTAESPVTYRSWQQRTAQAAAEEQQLLDAEPDASPSSGGSGRCPAAHPEDPTPCGGPVAVTVLDAENAGAKGCEHHAARLLASLDGGRVYALPDAPEGAAIRVFKAADGLRPFPWVSGPRTRDGQLSRAEVRERGERP